MRKVRDAKNPEDIATLDEIKKAFLALTDVEKSKLKQIAATRVKSLGHKALSRTGEDLLQEAFADVLSGRRRWNKSKVDFFGMIAGIMRSTVSHWRESFDDSEAMPESSFVVSSDEGDRSILDVAASDYTPESILLAKETLKMLLAFFKDDPLVTKVIFGTFEGKSAKEMTGEFQIKKSEFEAADKRLRRKIADMKSERRSND